MIGTIWERALAQSLGQNRRENRAMQLRALEAELENHPRRAALLEEFHTLGDVRPGPDGEWVATRDAQVLQ
jgi:hypothetical protein